jgi:hypothetical protein
MAKADDSAKAIAIIVFMISLLKVHGLHGCSFQRLLGLYGSTV